MKVLFSLLLMLCSNLGFAQEWQSYYSDSNIDIQFAIIDHKTPAHNHSHQRVVFNYVNKTTDELVFNFDRPLAYDGVELAASAERNFTVVLQPSESLGFDPETNKSKTFFIFSKDNNGMIKRKLTSFDITNLNYQ